MSLEYFFKLVRRYGFVIVAGALFGVAAAAGYAAARGGYEASSVVLVRPPAAAADRAVSDPERFVLTQQKVVTGDETLTAAADLLPGTPRSELESSLSVEGGVVDDTMTITASSTDAEDSLARVEAVTRAYAAIAESSRIDVEVLRVEQPAPSVSRTTVYAAGFLAGSLLGTGTLLLLGFTRRPILGTGAWLGDQRYGSVFPYLLRIRGSHGHHQASALIDWLVAADAGRDSAIKVLIQGVVDPDDAASVAQWMQSTEVGRVVVDEGGAQARDESEPTLDLLSGSAAYSADLVLTVVGRSTPRRTSLSTTPRLLVVKQGTPLVKLEQFLKLLPPGQNHRIVVLGRR